MTSSPMPTLHQQYMADISATVRTAIDTLDPTPYHQKYGKNTWAAVKAHLDPMESIRLDLGYGSQVHP
jgi:hypothetical protein